MTHIPSLEDIREQAMKMTLRKGMLCKYSKPGKGEAGFRFICLDDPADGDTSGRFQLVCDYFLKPVEEVEWSEMEPA